MYLYHNMIHSICKYWSPQAVGYFGTSSIWARATTTGCVLALYDSAPPQNCRSSTYVATYTYVCTFYGNYIQCIMHQLYSYEYWVGTVPDKMYSYSYFAMIAGGWNPVAGHIRIPIIVTKPCARDCTYGVISYLLDSCYDYDYDYVPPQYVRTYVRRY